ncbi:MAG: hypothetical protein ACRCZB_07610 [Bacteroidales bacterium]
MENTDVRLSQLSLNDDNPRGITDTKFASLIDSVLVFPKMLSARPIVVNDRFIVLGGNMRYKALVHISKMPFDDIESRIACSNNFQKKTSAEQDGLLRYWEEWISKPTVAIVKADKFSEQEQREFIIKDNLSYGEWDKEMLKKWDKEELQEWGDEDWSDEVNVDSVNEYSKKIECPIYEPKLAVAPNIEDLIDTRKYDELICKIERLSIGSQVKHFMRVAASRHIVFDYAKIAEFYAHADMQEQDIMEDLALVIIDFGKAIEDGYTTLKEDIISAYRKDYEE